MYREEMPSSHILIHFNLIRKISCLLLLCVYCENVSSDKPCEIEIR